MQGRVVGGIAGVCTVARGRGQAGGGHSTAHTPQSTHPSTPPHTLHSSTPSTPLHTPPSTHHELPEARHRRQAQHGAGYGNQEEAGGHTNRPVCKLLTWPSWGPLYILGY